MCAQFEILRVKVLIIFLGTVDFSLPRDGRYYKARGSAGKCDLAGIHSRSPVTHIKFMWTQFWTLESTTRRLFSKDDILVVLWDSEACIRVTYDPNVGKSFTAVLSWGICVKL